MESENCVLVNLELEWAIVAPDSLQGVLGMAL